MAERGQLTVLRFGAVSAEVALVNVAGKPPGAVQHETRRVLVEPAAERPAVAERHAAEREALVEQHERERADLEAELADPMGEDRPTRPPAEPAVEAFPHRPTRPAVDAVPARSGRGAAPVTSPLDPPAGAAHGDRVTDIAGDAVPIGTVAGGVEIAPAPTRERPEPSPPEPAPTYVPPVTRVEQGVHTPDGQWVDLTDLLGEVDARTKVDGLEVVATISNHAIPRERVIGAKYVAGGDPATYPVLALLWRALRHTDRAAAVRFTKRTAHALGLIVARGELDSPRPERRAHLVLLELEWAQNLRRPAPRVWGPITAEVSDAEVDAATDLALSFAAGPSVVNDLRDERLAKRRELLELARAGRLAEYVPPAEPMPDDLAADLADLAAAFGVSASWVREHADA